MPTSESGKSIAELLSQAAADAATLVAPGTPSVSLIVLAMTTGVLLMREVRAAQSSNPEEVALARRLIGAGVDAEYAEFLRLIGESSDA